MKHGVGKEYVHIKILISNFSEDERQNLSSDFQFVSIVSQCNVGSLNWVSILLSAHKRPVPLLRAGYSFKKTNIFMSYLLG